MRRLEVEKMEDGKGEKVRRSEKQKIGRAPVKQPQKRFNWAGGCQRSGKGRDQRSMGRGRIETIEGEIVKQGTWGGDAGSRQTGDTQIGYHPKVQTARKRSA